MKFVLIITLLLSTLIEGKPNEPEIPVLRFDGKLSWKGIFDAGFRPKRLKMLENMKAQVRNQVFDFSLSSEGPYFRLKQGLTQFQVLKDDKVYSLTHFERGPFTVSEGLDHYEELRNILDGHIIKHLTPPTQVNGEWVVRGGEDFMVAEFGESIIHYGFRNSYLHEKPLVGQFMISRANNDNLRNEGYDIHDKIQPPEGYEWFDMSPEEHPAFTQNPNAKPVSNSTQTSKQTVDTQTSKTSEKLNTKSKAAMRIWPVICGLMGILCLAIYFYKKRLFVRNA